jgi:thioredoxin family protein
MVTRERFEQGMTMSEYVDQMGMNMDRFEKVLADSVIASEDRAALDRRAGKLNVLVITEDWCGEAINSVPVVAKLIENNPRAEARVFLRDANPDLMDQYLKEGRYRSIPVFAFFDEEMNELARLIERAPRVTGDRAQDVVKEVRNLLEA